MNQSPMKVGLLQCDHVPAELQYIGGDYPAMFRALLPYLDFHNLNVSENEFPDSVQDYDAYVVTGSKHSVYEQLPWIFRLKNLVQEIYDQNKFYVGICFGHQMLAEALGGQVRTSEAGWCVGVHQFTVLRDMLWMHPKQENFSVLMSCQDQVTILPENSVHLAHSADCQYSMFQVGTNMLGIQGHPEFPKAYSKALMERRVDRIGYKKVNTGLESLKNQIDDRLIAGWIKYFLRSK